jgi:hypothetical protein
MHWTDERIKTLVDSAQLPIIYKPIGSISDIKESPYDVLVSRLMQRDTITKDQLSTMLQNYALNSADKSLDILLQEASTNNDPETDLLKVCESLDDIHKNTNYFVRALPISDGNKTCIDILIADKSEKHFKFPSGRIEPYCLLSNEYSANSSILSGATCTEGANPYTTSEIPYIREATLNFMLAYWTSVMNDSEFSEFREHDGILSQYIIAHLIAHELAELKNVQESANHVRNQARIVMELDSEVGAKKILEEEGFPSQLFTLYHKIKADSHKASIPRIILTVGPENFNPQE